MPVIRIGPNDLISLWAYVPDSFTVSHPTGLSITMRAQRVTDALLRLAARGDGRPLTIDGAVFAFGVGQLRPFCFKLECRRLLNTQGADTFTTPNNMLRVKSKGWEPVLFAGESRVGLAVRLRGGLKRFSEVVVDMQDWNVIRMLHVQAHKSFERGECRHAKYQNCHWRFFYLPRPEQNCQQVIELGGEQAGEQPDEQTAEQAGEQSM